MSVRIQLRRDTAANWASTNPTLTQGEPGYETDTGKIKYGDGSTAWNSLAYAESNQEFALGSAASPSIAFTGDTNTGIYSPGADQLAISTNGTGRLFVNASGNVGIGAAAAAGRNFALSNPLTGSTTSRAYTSIGEIKSDVTTTASYYATFSNTEAASFTLTNLRHYTAIQGSFGAGSTVANQMGFVAENGLVGATNNYGFYSDISSGTGRWNFYSAGTADSYFASNNFIFANGGTERARIDSSGRLGLGTSAPAVKLDAAETGSTSCIIRTKNDTTSVYLDANNGYAYLNCFSNHPLLFGTNNIERVRITSDGKVGIGVTGPSQKLEVDGNIRILNANNLQLANTGDVQFLNAGGTSYSTGIIGSSDNMILYTTDLERARIDSSGRLLVGTSSARSMGGISAGVFIEGTAYNSLSVNNNTNDAFSSLLAFGKSRGTVNGAVTIVSSGDRLGGINFYGADGSTNVEAARIAAEVDGTPGTNDMPGRLVFSTTADGSSSPTERVRITNTGEFLCPQIYNNTTALAANVYVGATGQVNRSTSSIKYKTDVQVIEAKYSDALLACRPVWYRSTCELDNPGWGYWGFIAEEVAAIDPRLVHWKTVEISYDEKGSAVTTPCDPEPEGVAYDRFVPHLLNLIKRQKEQIEAMEARLSVLEAQ